MSIFDHQCVQDGISLELTSPIMMRDGSGQALKFEAGQKPRLGRSGMLPQPSKDVYLMKWRQN